MWYYPSSFFPHFIERSWIRTSKPGKTSRKRLSLTWRKVRLSIQKNSENTVRQEETPYNQVTVDCRSRNKTGVKCWSSKGLCSRFSTACTPAKSLDKNSTGAAVSPLRPRWTAVIMALWRIMPTAKYCTKRVENARWYRKRRHFIGSCHTNESWLITSTAKLWCSRSWPNATATTADDINSEWHSSVP